MEKVVATAILSPSHLFAVEHIRFLLHFPHPFIPSELSGSRGNKSMSMSEFLFEDILPIIRRNSMQKVLD